MLPEAYELPAAILLVLSGAVACFAGYRLFRLVLGVYGFIVGAMFASSMMGSTNAVGMVAGALVGGLVGALILVFAYFVGIALVGAGLGAMVAHMAWTQFARIDPPALGVILLALAGAAVAMVLQRYVIIVGTAFSGAWTMIVGALALFAGHHGPATRSGSPSVWILYPMTPAPGGRWVGAVWLLLGLVGTAVQLGVTGRRR